MMMFANEMKQLKQVTAAAFAESKLSGDVRFSILQLFIFSKRD